MPEYFRALLFILLFASAIFFWFRRSGNTLIDKDHFTRRRNLWYVLTLSAYLSHNFWLYACASTLMLFYANRKEDNKVALFFMLLFALPLAGVPIPGFGIVNYIFTLDHFRMLSLFVLLPAYLKLRRLRNKAQFGSLGSDKVLAAYLVLSITLSMRGGYLEEASFTNTLRYAFYQFIDVFIPYYVISRYVRNMQEFKEAMSSFVIAVMILAPIAVFEAAKQWLLYQPLFDALGLNEGSQMYLMRDGMLRASASAGQAIVLGYIMVVGIGFYLFIQRFLKVKYIQISGMLILGAGLIAPLSRGPWVGAFVLFVIYIIMGTKPLRKIIGLIIALLLGLFLLSSFPGGQKIVNLLPYIGTTETENVDYRKNLIENSLIVIQRNPWIGSNTFLSTPEMESMRQGQGIIDIVNSYILIILEKGIIGLGLFTGFFISILAGIYHAMKTISNKQSEAYLLGQVLMATLMSILVMIATVSSIMFIPIIYWSVAGLGVAYIQLIKSQAKMKL